MLTSFLLQHTGTSLVDYRGMNTIGQLNLRERLVSIPTAYRNYFSDLIYWPYVTSIFRPFHFGAILLLIASNSFLIIREKFWEDPILLALIVIGWLLIPLTLNFVVVLAYEANIH